MTHPTRLRDRDLVSVPLNDPRRRFAEVREQMIQDFAGFLDHGTYIGGSFVADFERVFADWCGREFALAVANGTDALEVAARAAGVAAGDEVICVANAGGYSTVACVAIGAVPVYVDVNLGDAQISFDAAIAAINNRTKAIIVTHLFGLHNDVTILKDALRRQDRNDICIIEDCAQAHGAKAPSGARGDVATYSFYPTKNLGAIGDAGAVVTDQPLLAERVRALREYGWTSKYRSELKYGRNSRMDSLQAAVLIRSLDRVADQNCRRRQIHRRYTRALPSGWRLIGEDSERFVAHLCVLVAPDRIGRDRMVLHLDRVGIANAIHYPTLDIDQPAWNGVGRCGSRLINSYELLNRILTVPCFPELSESEIASVITALSAFED
jgi:dTDP-3-amino-2,3,6-trideoxy-4-keto-D-glucose/dTDP-3-amino-3,4,6-trideoxy-alpha-D-glucose/dTDP-2,6-dideoxy-D-kanosamine transaminase